MRAEWVIATLLTAFASEARGTPSPAALPRPTFETNGRDPKAFAVASEVYCGFQPGSALTVPRPRTIVVRLAEPKRVTYRRFMCLMDTLNPARLERRGVHVLVLGETVP